MVRIFALKDLLVHILEITTVVPTFMDGLVDRLVRLRFLVPQMVDKHVLNAQVVEVDTRCSQVAEVKDTQLLHQLVVGVDSEQVAYLKLHTHNILGDNRSG
jgi:hypothetical protein